MRSVGVSFLVAVSLNEETGAVDVMWIVAGFGAACAAIFLGGERLLRRRFSRIKQERAGEDFATFAASFPEGEIPVELLRQVYGFFQTWVGDADFPVKPMDSLSGVYGIVDDDVERMVEKIGRLTGREPLPGWQGAPLQTVGDVARLFAPIRKALDA